MTGQGLLFDLEPLPEKIRETGPTYCHACAGDARSCSCSKVGARAASFDDLEAGR